MEKNLLVFPNPVKDVLHFESDKTLPLNLKLSISNTLGQIIYSDENIDLKNGVDLHILKAGVYYVRLQDGDGQKVYQIMRNKNVCFN